MKRKLTTILFADAKGYSAMMASDEDATLERLRRYRSVMQGLFALHDGRAVNTWGDAVIAEFSSVVEAVRCAVEIQDSITTENQALPEARRMWFRIGINLGDVMIDGDDLYGDGVNVAERLESLAEPGGVLVSGTVYELVHKQLAIAFDFAGNREVKTGSGPVPSYRVRMRKDNAAAVPLDVAPRSAEAPAPSTPSIFARTAARLEKGWSWLRRQPRRVRFSAAAIAFFFVLNVLTDGLGNPWFLFPSAPFALYIYLTFRREQRRGRLLPP